MGTISTDYNNAYLTQSWLDSHQGASQALESNPSFLSFLIGNPDYAKSFTDSADGAQQAIQAAGDSGAIQSDAMSLLMGQASLAQGTMQAQSDSALFTGYNDSITSDWLNEHPGAALMLSQRPELVDFLNANPEAASEFVSGPEGATKAVEALLAQQPDLGWDVSQLIPGGLSVAEATQQDEAGGQETYTSQTTDQTGQVAV